MERDLDKVLNQIKKRKNNVIKSNDNFVIKKINRFLLLIILFLGVAIYMKTSSDAKNNILNSVFNTNFSFNKYGKAIKSVFGDLTPFKSSLEKNTKAVFNEKLNYSRKTKYQDGVKLTVTDNYLVPSLKSGIVVFIGKKSYYQNAVIVQGTDGVDYWYGNFDSAKVKIYDYVEKGQELGSVKGNQLMLSFIKNKKVLNYEKYLQ